MVIVILIFFQRSGLVYDPSNNRFVILTMPASHAPYDSIDESMDEGSDVQDYEPTTVSDDSYEINPVDASWDHPQPHDDVFDDNDENLQSGVEDVDQVISAAPMTDSGIDPPSHDLEEIAYRALDDIQQHYEAMMENVFSRFDAFESRLDDIDKMCADVLKQVHY